VGAGDLVAEELEEFSEAGRVLFSLGLVRLSEGNLSTFDGRTLRITQTGSELVALSEGDVLAGTLDDPPPGASSDLAIHVATYRARGAGAVAHAHPGGTVAEGWVEGEEHGVYAFAPTLSQAVEEIVRAARHGA